MKVVWVTPWESVCGIADYSKVLWPRVLDALSRSGEGGELVSLDRFPKSSDLVDCLRQAAPDVIHFQHEYGLFGGKNPPWYRFPGLVQSLKKTLPRTKLVATGHTVLQSEYRFEVRGRFFEALARKAANQFLLKPLQEFWGPKTWGQLDGVVVHSGHQTETVRKAGAGRVEVIPHFVPDVDLGDGRAPTNENVVVFGFFTPEKGQDIAIRALQYLPKEVRLTLAGGVRRPQDQAYYNLCMNLIQDLSLSDRVTVTGFVDAGRITALFSSAAVVLIPFRETSGSGSLVQALARGSAVVASDLLLNREINDREPGCLELFSAEDPQAAAMTIERVLRDTSRQMELRQAALRYSRTYSAEKVANAHHEFYRSLC